MDSEDCGCLDHNSTSKPSCHEVDLVDTHVLFRQQIPTTKPAGPVLVDGDFRRLVGRVQHRVPHLDGTRRPIALLANCDLLDVRRHVDAGFW